MNMNKALQNLYHAVSGSTTTKVNISKLLVDIHYAITGKESSNKNNWSRIINSMADNWPEGGGGSSDFSTAQVTIINNSGYGTSVYAPVYYDDDEFSGASSSYSAYSDGQNDTVANIILYKGEAFICCENNINWSIASATGDIEIDSEYPESAYVRGNGTITLAHHDTP